MTRERAELRRLAAQNNKQGEALRAVPIPGSEQKSEWRQRVGQQIGVSGATVQRATNAVKAKREAEKRGETKHVETLDKLLQTSAKKADQYDLIPPKENGNEAEETPRVRCIGGTLQMHSGMSWGS